MVSTRNQFRNGHDAPTNAELAELLRTVREDLQKTRDDLQNVTNQRDAFARALEEQADNSDRRNRQNLERSPTRSGSGPTPSIHSTFRAENENKAEDRPRFRNSGTGSSAFEYGNFMKCKPESFKGGSDPVVNLRWLSQMEVVFESCDCAEDKKVLFASRMLKESALDWWNGRKAALGTNYISQMTWSSFSKLFEAKYCTPRDKIVMEREFLMLKKGEKSVDEYVTSFYQKLQFCAHLCPDERTTITRFTSGLPVDYHGFCRAKTTMNEVIDEAKHVEDDLKLKAKKDGNSGFKRKFDGSSGYDKRSKSGPSSKGKDEKKWCSSCKAAHTGSCSEKTKRCDRCGKSGHATADCKDRMRCFRCGRDDHKIADCPQMKNVEKKDNNPPKAKARAFQMTAEDAKENDDVGKQ